MADDVKADAVGDLSLDDLLAQYIAAEEAGSPPDRQELLRKHPHYADDLREFFANRDQMQRLAEPLRGGADVSRGNQSLGKVRYFGDYELLEEVAAGGMGIIYKARQRSLNRIVAVKMILKGTLAREDDVKRFRAEAEAAASLQHPAIVAIHEVGLHEGQHYFSMDYVDGHSLAELPRERPLSAHQAAEYIRDAAEAVHYAHQQGTLHRDLKPSNILIDRQGRVRITDFGLAKRIEGNSDLTLTGQILGTPSYMPPEQANSKHTLVGVASDAYSLGAVLYELLTGRPPFRGESPAETLRQVETLDPVSPRLLSPATPRDLETICLKCLEKEPHKRYGTSQLLADDLGRYLRGEHIMARPISRTARVWRWCHRNPALAGLSSALFLVLLVATVASTVGYVSARRAWEHEVARRQAEDSLHIKEAVDLMQGLRPDFARAEQLLTDAIASQPRNAELYWQRGRAYFERLMPREALADAERSLELKPQENAVALLLVVEVAVELNEMETAREAAARLKQEAAESPEALAARGLVDPLDPSSDDYMSKAIEGAPHDPRYLGRRGWVAYQRMLYRTSKRWYDRAVEDYEHILQLRPFDRYARQQLCACYVGFHVLADEGARPLVRAKTLLDAWLTTSPGDVTAVALLAQLHLEQDQLEEALAVGKYGRELDDRRLELLVLEGETLLRQRRFDDAEVNFRAAEVLLNQQTRPSASVSRVRLASLRAQVAAALKRFAEAEELLAEFDPAAAGSSWSYDDWHQLVTAWKRLGDERRGEKASGAALANAQKLCKSWSAVAPESPGPAETLGLLESDFEARRDRFTVALRLGPSSRWPLFYRGKLFAESGALREAAADFEAFLRYFPDNSEASYELARLLFTARDPAVYDVVRARDLARRIIDRDSRRHDCWHLIAQAESQLGHDRQALEAIDAALAADAGLEPYLLLRGDILLSLGRCAEARATLEQSLATGQRSAARLLEVARRLATPGHGNRECYAVALALAEEAKAILEREGNRYASSSIQGIALFRNSRPEEALTKLDTESLFRVMALWQLGRRDESWRLYQELSRRLAAKMVMIDPTQRQLAETRREAARLIGAQFGDEAIRDDLAGRPVRPGDWPQWGGWAGRNNVSLASEVPTDWSVGEFDRKTGAWKSATAKNIKWVTTLGSQTYGNPVVANGRVFLGTNNSSGYLKRYPGDVDLGVLLCLRESDGAFLWQHSCEKLPTGRAHDWPLQGMCSAPLVEGDRLWAVTNRGEVVCLDTEGFYDGEDDGPEQGLTDTLFRVLPDVHSGLDQGELPPTMRAALSEAQLSLPRNFHIVAGAPGQRWFVSEWVDRRSERRLQIELINEDLQVRPIEAGQAEPKEIACVLSDRPLTGLGTPQIVESLRPEFARVGLELPPQVDVKTLAEGSLWTFDVARADGHITVLVRQESRRLVATQTDFTDSKNKQQADVVWSLDMMRELGISQHNMCTCAPTAWKDVLFICTSNGVDEAHSTVPAPDAPSFIALEKHSGKILWTDNSPGANIQHGQWSAPAVGVFAGVPQVIFGGGDGWVYSFHAEEWSDGKPKLLWKFDTNPKDAVLELGGRGTRDEPIAVPVVYDGLVYVTAGQDPEHGEGHGHIWCIDPTQRGDISPQLAVHVNDRNTVLPHKRIRAIEPEKGEIAIDNPNSAVVWHYSRLDANFDLKFDFYEEFHRSISSVVAKNDLLVAADFSGLCHCLNAKTGRCYWTSDLLAAVWATPLIVGERVYVPDEDGDIAICVLSPNPDRSTKLGQVSPGEWPPSTRVPLHEINMGNSVYCAPFVANGVLYITTKDHLFAIVEGASTNTSSDATKPASP